MRIRCQPPDACVGYRSFSASSRNSSGTEREFPTRPTRIRPPPIRSDRGSRRRRDRPHNAPCPPGAGAARLVRRGRAKAPVAAPGAPRDATRRSRAARCLLVRVMRQHRAHQLLGDLGEARGRRDRRVERYRARDRVQIGEANADRHGPPGQGFGAEPGADPVGEVGQRGPENALFGRLPADRRLGARRSRPPMRLDFPRIAIPRQRRELLSRRGTEQSLERPSRHLRQLSDGQHADLGQPRPGDRAHAPHQLDGQIVQELQFGVGIDDDQPVGLGHLRGNLRQMFGARHADRDRQAKLRPHAAPDRPRDVGRRAEEMGAARHVGKGLIDGDPLDRAA